MLVGELQIVGFCLFTGLLYHCDQSFTLYDLGRAIELVLLVQHEISCPYDSPFSLFTLQPPSPELSASPSLPFSLFSLKGVDQWSNGCVGTEYF